MKLLFGFILSLFALSTSAQLTYGGGINLWLEGETTIGLQGRAVYPATEEIDISGGFTFYLSDFLDYGIDVNAQYEVTTLGEDISFAPMAGINITDGFFSYTSLQIGAVFTKPYQEMNIFLEPKILLRGGTALLISGGVLF